MDFANKNYLKDWKNFVNEFLLLAVIIIYLAIKPPPQRADEKIASSPIQESSTEASKTSAPVI
jgi:hypothetical protein